MLFKLNISPSSINNKMKKTLPLYLINVCCILFVLFTFSQFPLPYFISVCGLLYGFIKLVEHM